MEDASEVEPNNSVAVVDAPPHAPSPPSAIPAESVNVFDFLVNDETPNASTIFFGASKERTQIADHGPSTLEPKQGSYELEGNNRCEEYHDAFKGNTYVYGADAVPTTEHLSYETPAPKGRENHNRDSIYELDGQERKSTDKKRKRQIEELDLTQARRSSQELDEEMIDAPPVLHHSGLTGGLNRLLSKSKFPPSPDYSGGDGNDPGPLSPVKRAKQIKDRDRTSSALIKVRKVRRTSDESRPRKHHRPHHQSNHDDHRTDRSKRTVKAIEYPSRSVGDSKQQLVLYRTRAELFMSFVTKGPESETGCSINKALKRYHRERGEQGLGLGKVEEEKELWKSLRLRRNERGEIVLLF